MKTIAITMLLLSAASVTTRAASIDGKWISEMTVGDGNGGNYTHISTFTLKNDGGLLTGAVVQV